MRSQHRLPRNRPEAVPRDLHDAADAHARNVYVTLADALPHGRKVMGPRQCRRVTMFASHASAPTAADWSRLIAAGAPRESVITYYLAAVDTLRSVPVPDVRLCVAEYIRESSEAAAALLDYERDPSPENLTRATNEALDGANAGGVLARGVLRMRHMATEARTMAVGRFAPARSDRRIGR